MLDVGCKVCKGLLGLTELGLHTFHPGLYVSRRSARSTIGSWGMITYQSGSVEIANHATIWMDCTTPSFARLDIHGLTIPTPT